MHRSDTAALNSRKNSINENGLQVSGIRGVISQGLTRAQHSAMDLRKSVLEAPTEQGRRGSFQTWFQKDERVEPTIYVNPSDDVGCMNDFVGIEAGEETGHPYHGHEFKQNISNEGIQIVVQEHIDPRWETENRRASQVSEIQGFQDPNPTTIGSQSRRGRILILIIFNCFRAYNIMKLINYI